MSKKIGETDDYKLVKHILLSYLSCAGSNKIWGSIKDGGKQVKMADIFLSFLLSISSVKKNNNTKS